MKLDGTSRYKLCKKENNMITLLTMIRGYCCQFDALKDEYLAIVVTIKNLLLGGTIINLANFFSLYHFFIHKWC